MGMPSSSRSGTPTALSEINVTPLVDVMLVLLIVFMVSAPLMQQGIQVDLPKANAETLSQQPEQIVIAIQKNATIKMGDKIIPSGTLKSRLQAIQAANPNVEVFIQGDQGVPYGVVAQVMAEVKGAKIHRVGLVTLPAEGHGSL
jgi:biopolymer transport protein TolR